MEFTGERMIPEHNGSSEIYHEHIVRYLFATQYVEGKNVVDIASGSGYGSHLLKEKGAERVLGIDISEEAVAYAKEKYAATDELTFLQGSALEIPVEDRKVDLLVSFETIEHIPTPDVFLKETRRVLKENGVLIISTPIKGNYPPGNPYHLEEFTEEEFQSMLEKEFQFCERWYQEKVSSQSLYKPGELLEGVRGTYGAEFQLQPWYQVWVCSNEKLQETYKSLSLIKEDGELKDYKAGVNYLEHVVEVRENELQEVKQHREELLEGIRFRDEKILSLTEKNEQLIADSFRGITTFPTYDIIIPVFNGYEFVRDCVGSVLRHTAYPSYRILLIDDCSTDIETVGYMVEMSERHEQIIYLRQKENGGFVRSVNAGMAYSTHDVVLLNSDTVVTENWLLQMHQCRQQVGSVGSITPLTNNGTICSVPHWLQDNAVPEGMTAESMGKLIQRISQRVYPVLPTAVGFCMLIPREVLDTVGLFDEETFGRGYGEENDWCMRAWYLGYQHYLDDATFIQHKGSMTFGDNPKKQALLTENLQKLAKKHPSYLPMVDRFIASDPLREIIDLVGLHLEFTNGKKNILEVLHADVRNQVGGTELHVHHLTSHFSDEYNIFVLFPEPHHKRLTLVLYKNGSITREFHFPVEQTAMTTLMYNASVMKIMKQVLSEACIEFVHFHHLMHLPLTLPEVCTSAGVPYVCTVHDYFFYCQCPQLLDQGKLFCEFSKDKERCTNCIASNPHMQEKKGLTFGVLEQRRQVWKRILEGAQKVIAPSEYVKGAVEKELSIPSEQIEVIPHGLDYVTMKPKGEQTRDKLRIAFLGAFTSIKGSKLFAELVLSTDHPHVEFYILGAIGDTETFQRIHKKVKYLGPFERTDVSSLLHRNEIDVVVLPSIWPETFAYTLSEAWGSGLKVITTSFGAQLDRLQSRKDAGWAFPITTWARETRSLLHELWDQKSGGVNLGYYGGVGNTVEVMLSSYGELYTNIYKPSKLVNAEIISRHLLYKGKSTLSDTSYTSINKLTWDNYVYLLLVKLKLIGVVRPIYYFVTKYRK